MRPDPGRDGYSASSWQDRLIGLGLMVLGAGGFVLVYVIWTRGPLLPAAPPGMPRGIMPLLSPLACLVPAVALASCGLILVGFRRLVSPD